MKDTDCVAFLQWALPKLDLRWAGFRKVRRQVCKRISRRMRALGLSSLSAYRERLARDPDEWIALDSFCRIPISRFWRDRGVYDQLANDILPRLAAEAAAAGRASLRAWSAGCASGEEPYSLAIAFVLGPSPSPRTVLEIIATDADANLLARAKRGVYGAGSLKDLPPAFRTRAFEREGPLYRIRPEYRAHVTFRREDIRARMPRGPFDILLCRNLVFTYFGIPLQRALLPKLASRVRRGGFFVIGSHERLPEGAAGLTPEPGAPGIYRRNGAR